MGTTNTVTFSNGVSGSFEGLTITGGNQGVLFQQGTQMGLSKCIIRDNGAKGIMVNNYSANVRNCIIHEQRR